ncbi:MAG: hypothetical protein ACFFCP_03925 [Promethearchaeota archaeon]
MTVKLSHAEVNAFLRSFSEREVSTSFQSLLASFFQLAEARLSDSQKLVLRMSREVLKYRRLTMTALADMVSRRSGIPYSTVKWNLRSLKQIGLLTGGDLKNKGRFAWLTDEAQMLVEFLEKNL